MLLELHAINLLFYAESVGVVTSSPAVRRLHGSIFYNCNILTKIECKGQTYKTAEIIFLCHKVLCLFCTVTFTSKLIAKRHRLSCHYKCAVYLCAKFEVCSFNLSRDINVVPKFQK